MSRRSFEPIGKKGAAYCGLFFGVWLGLAGCVTPTVEPGITNTPTPMATEGVKPTPEPEAVTVTPVPQVPESVVKPTVAPTAGPTEGPEMTPSGVAEPTECPVVTATMVPEVSVTPELQEWEITTVLSPTPEVTAEVLPEPTMAPVALPTAMPEYDTLLQNGWQRTEDFFGCCEIFFSGKFDDAESVVEEGSYEFCYRAISDVSVLLRIIGEEGMGVQPFLEELRQNRPGCRIEQEGPEDYSYTYIEGKTQVTGRIYACGDAKEENRMRVEFYSLAGVDLETEGYGFYLR